MHNEAPDNPNMYTRLISLLDGRGARYRVVDHAPEGRTDLVSAMRGNDAKDAAKCMVLIVKIGKRTTKYVSAVIPGDRRLDLTAVKNIFGATYVSFASPEIAQRLAGSVPGTILPFSFTPELELIADPSLRSSEHLYFNAARLDRSIALNSEDYFAIAAPRVERVVGCSP
ncbi:MAG: YbaK/prolyl-tRNA synthetase associated domain-containing protein [Acidobacteria bacterium]|nr:YbaK/prolyl-tRNA synthetase associated domain-containing protein [Acidobacteriota bacterium]